MKFVYIETYGCAANQNNSEIMRGLLSSAGLELTTNPKIADLLIINTCIVKSPTESKMRDRILKLQELNKPLIVAGCLPEVRATRLKTPNLYLLGTNHVKDILKLIRKIIDKKYTEKEFLSANKEIKLGLPKISSNKLVGITQISEGCLNECSFCLTRLAKGKLFSYPKEEVIKNIKNDLKNCKEIWLTSQDLASYGLENGKRELPDLLNSIIEIKGKFQVRLGMMNPENILPILNELIDGYKSQKIRKFLHIPLQSGSNRILKLMNRKYTQEQFSSIVEKFRKEIPGIIIWSDIIVGFPQETEQDFQETISLLKKLKLNFIHISRYWPMSGTKAASMQQIDRDIIKQRIIKLNKELNRKLN